MLLPENIKPENSIYYNGAYVLQALFEVNRINIFDLFSKVCEKININYSIFILCIDWLYLLNIINLENEEVFLCI